MLSWLSFLSAAIFANAEKHANQFYKQLPNSSFLPRNLSWGPKASEIPLLTMHLFTFLGGGGLACLSS